jgi:hypothetical protein
VNAPNAYIFMAIGSAMGLLAHVFPSWFPPASDDATGARVLWLNLMATIQIGVGLAYVVQANVFPLVARLVSAVRTADSGSLSVPKARGIAGR